MSDVALRAGSRATIGGGCVVSRHQGTRAFERAAERGGTRARQRAAPGDLLPLQAGPEAGPVLRRRMR